MIERGFETNESDMVWVIECRKSYSDAILALISIEELRRRFIKPKKSQIQNSFAYAGNFCFKWGGGDSKGSDRGQIAHKRLATIRYNAAYLCKIPLFH